MLHSSVNNSRSLYNDGLFKRLPRQHTQDLQVQGSFDNQSQGFRTQPDQSLREPSDCEAKQQCNTQTSLANHRILHSRDFVPDRVKPHAASVRMKR